MRKSCSHCNVTSFVCACGRDVCVVEIVDIFHVGECYRCGTVEEPCLDRLPPDTPKARRILGRFLMRLSELRPLKRKRWKRSGWNTKRKP